MSTRITPEASDGDPDALIDAVLTAPTAEALWLTADLVPYARKVSLVRLLPLLDGEEDVLILRVLRCFHWNRLEAESLASGIARALPRLRRRRDLYLSALTDILALSPWNHVAVFREAVRDSEPAIAAVGIRGLTRCGEPPAETFGTGVVAGSALELQLLRGAVEAGEAEFIERWLARAIGADPKDSNGEILAVIDFSLGTDPDWTYLEEVSALVTVEESDPLDPRVLRRERASFLVPNVDRAARERSRLAISFEDSRRLLDLLDAKDHGAVFALCRELSLRAIDFAVRDLPEFAPLGRGLAALLRGLDAWLGGPSADDPLRDERRPPGDTAHDPATDPALVTSAAEIAYAILGLAIRAAPPEISDDCQPGTHSKSWLLRVSRSDILWWHTDLLHRMATGLGIGHWERLAQSEDRFVRANARVVLVALDPSSPASVETFDREGLIHRPSTLQQLVDAGGDRVAVLVLHQVIQNELDRSNVRQERLESGRLDESFEQELVKDAESDYAALVDSLIVLGRSAAPLVDDLLADTALEFPFIHWLLIAFHTGSRSAQERIFRTNLPAWEWQENRAAIEVALGLIARRYGLEAEVAQFKARMEREHRLAIRSENRSARKGGKGFEQIHRQAPKVSRNDPCPCGSGKKHKKCCGATAG